MKTRISREARSIVAAILSETEAAGIYDINKVREQYQALRERGILPVPAALLTVKIVKLGSERERTHILESFDIFKTKAEGDEYVAAFLARARANARPEDLIGEAWPGERLWNIHQKIDRDIYF